jgi:hypothetical protein
VHEQDGEAAGPVLVPAAAGEEAHPWLDLEQAHLVRGAAVGPRPRPAGERLGVAVGEQGVRPERLRRESAKGLAYTALRASTNLSRIALHGITSKSVL